MNRKYTYPLLTICFLILAALACGQPTTGQKVEQSASTAATPTTVPAFSVGDVIQVSDHTITLNEKAFTGNVLQVNFTVENISDGEIIVSSLLGFEARGSDGTKLETAWDCGPSLDGSVLPGDKLRGNLCWYAPSGDAVKLYYKPRLFSSGAIVWVVFR